MKKVLITGANGMFGQDFINVLTEFKYEPVATDVDTLNITDKSAVEEFFRHNKPDFVVHAAAYTNVDLAETEQEKAFLINHTGTENIAEESAKYDIPIVYISTDYVFDGTKTSPYMPDDKTCPINVYGMSKLKGEEAVIRHNPNHYIARTSWLYGHKGKNFVETMISLASKNPELRVVSDQVGCPTWTVDLAYGLINLIDENKPLGTYHVCGSGHTSWHGFASKIMELMNIPIPIIPVTTSEFPRPAKRPQYSVMDNNGICPDWEDALKRYIKARN